LKLNDVLSDAIGDGVAGCRDGRYWR